ncbi:MAG: anthranilate phosphoribosyltransferase [Thermoleophilia bacterium]|jgi:anthranilate phosphoribosyltransferase|nr:anthranilate phosphoribosyltransferase [Thermoleophilia bacterium]
MSPSVTDVLAALVGGETLDRATATALMDGVMRGEVADAQFGAVFALLHARGETVEELTGFAQSMRAHAVRVDAPQGAIDTCGTGGDGADTFNISTCAAFVAAGAGAVVAKHGNRAVSSKCGSADVLEALGGSLEESPASVLAHLEASGFAFMFAPAFHPAMRHAAGPRRALATRTAFNYLGPICNPAGVRRQVVGVSDAAAAERLASVLAELGCEHALVVHGTDGLDELSLDAPSIVYEVTTAGVSRSTTSPEELGLQRAPISALVGGDAAVNADILRRVLEGAAGPARDAVVLNAAAAVVVAGLARDLHDGVHVAQRSIDEGAALDRLERWVQQGSEVAA